MEDINKVKPYIANLDRQLQDLKPLLESFNAKSLDEQLLLLNDERQRLELTNRYAYLLSSLMFAYMKVLNYKDMSPIMGELARVRRYMDSTKKLDSSEEQKEQDKKEEQNRAKQVLNKALMPSISQANFQGKHTKFDSKDGEKSSSDDDDNHDEDNKDSKKDAKVEATNGNNKKKNLPGRTKGKSETSKSNSRSDNNSTKILSSSSSTKTGGKSNKVTKPSKSMKSKSKVGTSNR